MTVSESYPVIHLGGLSNRFYRKIGIMFSEIKTFCFETVFLTLGLGMRKRVDEDSSHGIGHVDIRVGIMNPLECVCLVLHEHLGGE